MLVAFTYAVMLVTGIIVAPAVIATPAIQDLANLRTVINSAASAIGNPQNPNRGWGFFGGSDSQMGTADLINNITSTVLQSKFQIDTNKTAWLDLTNTTADPALNTTVPLAGTPTLPISASMVLPSVLPTSTPSLGNITTDLSSPYIDYVSSIPNLTTSLISLGRAWHREMNAPVSQAIGVLQESVATLQTTMLESNLIDGKAVLRTVRASTSLESAQQAWSRFLNLPGSTGSSGPGDEASTSYRRRSVQRVPLANGKQYTHKDLWGRMESSAAVKPGQYDVAFAWGQQLEDHRSAARLFRA